MSELDDKKLSSIAEARDPRDVLRHADIVVHNCDSTAAKTKYPPESFSFSSKHETLHRGRPTQGELEKKIPPTYSRPLVAAILQFNMAAILDIFSAITPKLRQVETFCLLLTPILRVEESHRTH